MIQEKAVNHGVHGEHGVKTMDCSPLGIHPLGEFIKTQDGLSL
jgi:hypothetical protein